jgi:hypothetical protein
MSKTPKQPKKGAPSEKIWLTVVEALRKADLSHAMAPLKAGSKPSGSRAKPIPGAESLLPAEYTAFVRSHGYPVVVLGYGDGHSTLAFLPPAWQAEFTRGMGEPGRIWEEVVAERRKGTFIFKYLGFAAHQVGEVNGYCFGRPEGSAEPLVYEVEESLPLIDRPLGTFSQWLERHAPKLVQEAEKIQNDPDLRQELQENLWDVMKHPIDVMD